MEEFMSNILVKTFFDPPTFTLTYLVYDENTSDAVIIDPVLNYDAASSTLSTESLKELQTFVQANQLSPKMVLETHAHADHISSSSHLKKIYSEIKLGAGLGIVKVQEVFKKAFNLEFLIADGSQFDLLLKDGEVTQAGSISIKTISTPGHTPACVSFLIEDMVFTGDALFMPDYGTGRCDFPEGSAADLYESIHNKLYRLPEETRVFVGHDYQPGGRELKFETTIRESRQANIQLKSETTKEEFVTFRTKRDAGLNAPKLLLPSIQININAGELPPAEQNGISYLKIPVNIKGEAK